MIPGQDIYSLDERDIGCSAPCSAPEQVGGARDKSSLLVDPPGKWSCPACTYLNFSRYVRQGSG
jgi:hypothetical protein